MRLRHVRRAWIGGAGRAALLPPAALAVHQLRYLLAFGGSAGLELERQGHSYLHSLLPWLIALVAVAAGGFLHSLGRAFGGHATRTRFGLSFLALWLACTVALVAIYAGQELLEGWMVTGHPAGLAGVFGYGGWWALPAAACVGLVLAAVFHGARLMLRAVARGHAGRAPSRVREVGPLAARPLMAVPTAAPLIAGWSDRGPPA